MIEQLDTASPSMPQATLPDIAGRVDNVALEPQWLRRGQIPALHGVRAIAVLLVILAHAHQTLGFPAFAPLHWIGSRGAIGVEVFFLLSGFLITNLMLRELTKTGRISVKHFYLRRILRIVPAYLAFLLVVACMQAGGLAELAGRDWAAAITYTVNFLRQPAWEIGHAWSLSIEEHFYLVWPMLMAGSAAAFGRRFALFCIVFCFVVRWLVLLLFPTYTAMAELWTFTRMDSIATGCVLAFLAWDPVWRDRLNRYCTGRAASAGAFVCLCASLWLSFSGKFAVGLAYSLNALCIAVLVWAAVQSRGTWTSRLLSHWTFSSIGVLSYSLYLWQQIFLHPAQDSFACKFPQNVIFAFLAAACSYLLIEKPFLSLKSRLSA